MSWSEDDWGKPFFPTRFGSPQGHATERKMLDAVGGFDGIRTKIRTNPDGSTTILKTRGGMPTFYTGKPEDKPEEEEILTCAGVPVSHTHQYGFANKKAFDPMTFPSEAQPGSALVRVTRQSLSFQYNKLYSSKPDEEDGEHPGNRSWFSTEAPKGILSWWAPTPLLSQADGMYEASTPYFLGGSLQTRPEYNKPDPAYPKEAWRAIGGHVYFEGEKLFDAGSPASTGQYILAACLVTEMIDGVPHRIVRYVAGAAYAWGRALLDLPDNALMLCQHDVTTGEDSVIGGTPYRIHPEFSNNIAFDASGTKFCAVMDSDQSEPYELDRFHVCEVDFATIAVTQGMLLYQRIVGAGGTERETREVIGFYYEGSTLQTAVKHNVITEKAATFVPSTAFSYGSYFSPQYPDEGSAAADVGSPEECTYKERFPNTSTEGYVVETWFELSGAPIFPSYTVDVTATTEAVPTAGPGILSQHVSEFIPPGGSPSYGNAVEWYVPTVDKVRTYERTVTGNPSSVAAVDDKGNLLVVSVPATSVSVSSTRTHHATYDPLYDPFDKQHYWGRYLYGGIEYGGSPVRQVPSTLEAMLVSGKQVRIGPWLDFYYTDIEAGGSPVDSNLRNYGSAFSLRGGITTAFDQKSYLISILAIDPYNNPLYASTVAVEDGREIRHSPQWPGSTPFLEAPIFFSRKKKVIKK